MGATLTPPQTVAAFTPLATHSPLQKAEQLPRCWNGSDASLLSELPRLSGEAALRQCPWKARVELAFESFDHCRIQAAHSTKTTKAECPLLGVSGLSAMGGLRTFRQPPNLSQCENRIFNSMDGV